MYKYWKIREIIAKFAAIFGYNRSIRRRIRDKIRFHDLIADTGITDIPIQKYPHQIPIAFCFNGNGYKLAAVAIKSLILSAKKRCDYTIYCVIDRSVLAEHRRVLGQMIQGSSSQIVFITANHDFDRANRRGWPVAIYYRMMLPKLLPDLDRIIYADIDTIFCQDLTELAQLDMGTNLVAGVRDYANGYINSGLLVMNLSRMRAENIYDKWLSAAHRKDYKNPDQDLLNYTTRGRILYLPLRFNFQSMLGARLFKTHDARAFDDLRHRLVVMHYSNWMKPWYSPIKRPVFSDIWWNIARQTGLY